MFYRHRPGDVRANFGRPMSHIERLCIDKIKGALTSSMIEGVLRDSLHADFSPWAVFRIRQASTSRDCLASS